MLLRSVTIRFIAAVTLSAIVPCGTAAMNMKMSAGFDRDKALAISRGAIGNRVSDARLQKSDGSYVQLRDYLGKPLVLSFIYTSCYHICPTTTKHLDSVVKKARDVLGDDSFNVVTIGFDSLRDTPPMMKQFRRGQGVDDEHWQFLSADEDTIDALTDETGFIFYPSPNGFDHLIQTTIVDQNGMVFRQLYGMNFDVPLLIEPLKSLVFDTKEDTSLLDSVGKQVRLFCTVYDPASGSYRFDYSVFIGTFIGLVCCAWVGFNLVREWRYTLKHKS